MAPVIVVGAGPVGQTTALLLARWQVPVLLLDEQPRRVPVGSKAICQQRDVLDIWESVGVGAQLAAEGVTWSEARIFWKSSEIASWRFVDRGTSPFPPFVNISQARTEQLLDEAIAASPLIDVRRGHQVVGIQQDQSGVQVECQAEGRTVTFDGTYGVCCCGTRGAELRNRLGVEFPGESYGDRFLICDIRADLGDWTHERRFYFDPPWNPGRQVLIHACPDSTYRIDWQVPVDFDLTVEEQSGGLRRRIEEIVGTAPYEVVWRSVYRFQARVASQFRVGRVFLAGDMAHLVAPFGARGLNSGVMDAENIAWKLAFVLNGWSRPELLDTYDLERRAAALENLAVTEETMRFLVPGGADDARARRDALSAAANDPAQWHRVNSGRFAEPYWYVDSPLTTHDPSRPVACRPDLGHTSAAAPGVVIPDVRVATESGWLRRIARDGLLLLVANASDERSVQAVASQMTGVPVNVASLQTLDPLGELSEVLHARPGEIWIVRPDAYIAAIATDIREQLPAAIARSTRCSATTGIAVGPNG